MNLPQTYDIAVHGKENFSVSPDGAWLLFQSSQSTPTAPLYVFYAVRTQRRHEISVSSEVQTLIAADRGFLQHVGCWDEDSQRVFMPSMDSATVFVTEPGAVQPHWSIHASLGRTEFRKIYECSTDEIDPVTIVNVLQPTAKHVDLVDVRNTSAILASHSATPLETRISIEYLSVATQQTALTYVVTGYRGSFISRSQGYMISLTAQNSPPILLAERTFGPLRWGPKGEVVYGSIGKADGTLFINQWQVHPVISSSDIIQ